MIKSTWRADGNKIYEDDIFIGNYASPESAHYVARLHNNHQSRNTVLSQVDEMFQSEINFTVTGFWDGGITWSLDDSYHGNEQTIEEALIALRNRARHCYPDSLFAQRNSFDMELETDQRTAEDLTYELGQCGEFTTHYAPVVSDPYESQWTITINNQSYGGYTLLEGLKFALDQQAVKGEK